MKQKLSGRDYTYVASMLFGMFFGAGNLIFPVHMGQMAGANIWPAVIGFCVTGVGLPLLGVAALGISRSGGLFELGSRVGKPYSMFFTCLLYLTIGPLFAIPRCATVSFTTGITPLLGADSPEQLLWAGIGDALSKEYEAVFSSKDDTLSHTPLMGKQISRICTAPLIEYGAEALESIREKKASFALDQVTLDIIISTGIVSNMMSTVDSYYYNSTLAHCVFYGSPVPVYGHTPLHGVLPARV